MDQKKNFQVLDFYNEMNLFFVYKLNCLEEPLDDSDFLSEIESAVQKKEINY